MGMDVSAADRDGIIVLGGGLAGLTASLFSNAPIFEAEDHSGGVAASDKIDGFTFDRGIHVLQTKNQEILDLFEEVGIKFAIRERSAHIYASGKYTAYPFQINSTNLPIIQRIKCVRDYLQREKNPEPRNYEDWIRREIGNGFADKFLIPYSEKFWGVHPRSMSFEWTGNRVPKANLWQVLRGAIISRNTRVGTNASFRYPDGADGYGRVAAAIRAKLGSRLHLGHRARHLDTKRRRVIFENGAVRDYRVLLSTIPLPELIRIATDVPPEVQAAASTLRTNSIMVVNLGIGRADLSPKHWIHFPEDDISFFRISFPHNFSPALVPPGMSSISAEVSYPTGSPPDRDALIERVIKDLIKVRVLRPDDKVVARHTRDIPFGYCIFTDERRKSLAIIKSWLNEVGIVPSGRYGLWAYFWSDEAVLSGKKSAELAARRLREELNEAQAQPGLKEYS
jgi:UDP-galactopyranose mutase